MLILGALLNILGCAQRPAEPPVSAGEPLGLQMVRTEAQLRNYPFFTLLSFERDTDPVFVRAEGAAAKPDPARAHTGSQSLLLPKGTTSFAVKLSSLHSGREFPGPWTLLGAYFYSPQRQRLTASYELDNKPLATYTVELLPGQWTPVLLDIAAALDGKSTPAVGALRFKFADGLPAPLWCDDVIELNNATTHVDADGFLIQERGFQVLLQQANLFKLALKTPEATDQGWSLEEANELFARFSSKGRQKSRIIYADGRQFIDGAYQPLGPADAVLARQHATPARLTISADMGRVDRNTPGDANNDGYAEQSGTYQIVALLPRLEVLIAPQTPALKNPILEIANLPAGNVLATMEGTLVKKVIRLESGRVLIELAGTLDRPTTVNVRINQQ